MSQIFTKDTCVACAQLGCGQVFVNSGYTFSSSSSNRQQAGVTSTGEVVYICGGGDFDPVFCTSTSTVFDNLNCSGSWSSYSSNSYNGRACSGEFLRENFAGKTKGSFETNSFYQTQSIYLTAMTGPYDCGGRRVTTGTNVVTSSTVYDRICSTYKFLEPNTTSYYSAIVSAYEKNVGKTRDLISTSRTDTKVNTSGTSWASETVETSTKIGKETDTTIWVNQTTQDSAYETSTTETTWTQTTEIETTWTETADTEKFTTEEGNTTTEIIENGEVVQGNSTFVSFITEQTSTKITVESTTQTTTDGGTTETTTAESTVVDTTTYETSEGTSLSTVEDTTIVFSFEESQVTFEEDLCLRTAFVMACDEFRTDEWLANVAGGNSSGLSGYQPAWWTRVREQWSGDPETGDNLNAEATTYYKFDDYELAVSDLGRVPDNSYAYLDPAKDFSATQIAESVITPNIAQIAAIPICGQDEGYETYFYNEGLDFSTGGEIDVNGELSQINGDFITKQAWSTSDNGENYQYNTFQVMSPISGQRGKSGREQRDVTYLVETMKERHLLIPVNKTTSYTYSNKPKQTYTHKFGWNTVTESLIDCVILTTNEYVYLDFCNPPDVNTGVQASGQGSGDQTVYENEWGNFGFTSTSSSTSAGAGGTTITYGGDYNDCGNQQAIIKFPLWLNSNLAQTFWLGGDQYGVTPTRGDNEFNEAGYFTAAYKPDYAIGYLGFGNNASTDISTAIAHGFVKTSFDGEYFDTSQLLNIEPTNIKSAALKVKESASIFYTSGCEGIDWFGEQEGTTQWYNTNTGENPIEEPFSTSTLIKVTYSSAIDTVIDGEDTTIPSYKYGTYSVSVDLPCSTDEFENELLLKGDVEVDGRVYLEPATNPISYTVPAGKYSATVMDSEGGILQTGSISSDEEQSITVPNPYESRRVIETKDMSVGFRGDVRVGVLDFRPAFGGGTTFDYRQGFDVMKPAAWARYTNEKIYTTIKNPWLSDYYIDDEFGWQITVDQSCEGSSQ